MAEHTDDSKITENDYLEMANDCKNRLDDKEREIKIWKKKYMKTKKMISMIYGNIRSLEDYLEDVSPDVAFDPVAENYIHKIRSECSNHLFQHEETKLDIVTDIILVDLSTID